MSEKKNTESYTFKKNYYFMMGDNRSKSIDSRYRGFVPEENIEGKALYILPLGQRPEHIASDITR